ncbi:MAG: hypothetical protein ACRCX4_13585 [Bacteroidales bacterium]
MKLLLMGLLSLFLYTSCNTNDQPGGTEEQSTQISFQFDAKKIFDSKAYTAEDGFNKCLSDININTLAVDITLIGPENKTLTNIPVKLFGDVLKTDPIDLKSGIYTVINVIVYSGGIPVYAGVVDDQDPSTPLPVFASFIPTEELMGNKKFTLQLYTKPTVSLYVLCAYKEPASNFGMPKFELNFIEVTCFDIFINVCKPNGEHIVGEGAVYLLPYNTPLIGAEPDYSKALYKDVFNGGVVDGKPDNAGDIATVCFPNNLQIPDNQEVYELLLVIDNAVGQRILKYVVTVEDLLRYKESELWDDKMNAIHIEYCNGIPFCILPTKDCGGTGTSCDPFNPNSGGLETFDNYNSTNELQNAWPWTIKNNNKIDLIGLYEGGSDDYIYVKGNQQGEVTWTSSLFEFKNGDVIGLDAAIRKLNSDDEPGEPGGNSFDAWLKVNLIDNDGKKMGTEWKVKMQSDEDFSFTHYKAFNRHLGTGCYRLQITLDMQSGKQERFEFKMDNVKVGL